MLKVPSVVHGGEEFMWNVAAMDTWVPPGPGIRGGEGGGRGVQNEGDTGMPVTESC